MKFQNLNMNIHSSNKSIRADYLHQGHFKIDLYQVQKMINALPNHIIGNLDELLSVGWAFVSQKNNVLKDNKDGVSVATPQTILPPLLIGRLLELLQTMMNKKPLTLSHFFLHPQVLESDPNHANGNKEKKSSSTSSLKTAEHKATDKPVGTKKRKIDHQTAHTVLTDSSGDHSSSSSSTSSTSGPTNLSMSLPFLHLFSFLRTSIFEARRDQAQTAMILISLILQLPSQLIIDMKNFKYMKYLSELKSKYEAKQAAEKTIQMMKEGKEIESTNATTASKASATTATSSSSAE